MKAKSIIGKTPSEIQKALDKVKPPAGRTGVQTNPCHYHCKQHGRC